MQVIDYEPGCWFLLQEGEAVYLDVRCDRGAVSFSITVQLTQRELEFYAWCGRAHIVSLADEISFRADPAGQWYLPDRDLQDRITAAVIAWNQQHK